ncbi:MULTISPECIES: DUF3298 and DUF4163 domain-containing protein [unclassified Lentimicrobium]|uniref:DUF3298 and DUF4163 domain-containing protein n=1 Tax=unclassified Lentimicrobium TaxID=2677434 RepID=UPI0015553185|nr:MULTISPECIES: DUF3298 and DUF4163 domain-containing protein [unclassified Lentimicrobium]NPD46221.1 DUF3298 domain-containing protein [Lentimicrobium sp. S6]NPD86271.1 DUF3298 domain-containing protein [Lentimicrobium sp. L6]
MNKINLYKPISIALILCALVFSSCKNEAKEEASLTFTEYSISEEIYLFGNENYPAFNLDVHIKLPEDKMTYQGLRQAMMKSYFDSLYLPQKTIQENLEALAQAHVSEYRAIEKELVLDSMDIGSSYNWEMIVNNQVLKHNQYFVSFMNEIFSFTGGAHGNTIRNHYVFDVKNDKLLSAGDLLNLSKCEDIIELQKKSAEKAGIILDDIFTGGFRCNNNFYLIEEGFIFHYDQYEIASYADGPIDIFISFTEIAPFLLDEQLAEKLFSETNN